MRAAPFEFVEAIASQRKRERGETTNDGRSTFNYTVSHAPGDQVPVQITEAERFLTLHEEELLKLLSDKGVVDAALDFGWDMPVNSIGQFNNFPPSLLCKCAKLNIAITVSVYHCSENGVVSNG